MTEQLNQLEKEREITNDRHYTFTYTRGHNTNGTDIEIKGRNVSEALFGIIAAVMELYSWEEQDDIRYDVVDSLLAGHTPRPRLVVVSAAPKGGQK